MFKRFACFILSLVLLMGLIPMAAIPASAASRATSDKAVTILKKVEQFVGTCNSAGYIGYGTKCTESGVHGTHTIREEEASADLKKALSQLDTAVNTFASDNGVSLTQYQHDALVLFTFRNGKAWMNGADDLRAAVIQGVKGNAFLNQMVTWKGETDVEYRLILANMYLNDQYESSAPDTFVEITYALDGGSLASSKTSFWYDRNLAESVLPVPTKSGNRFAGWLKTDKDRTTLTNSIPHSSRTLYASWQENTVTKEWGNVFGKELDSDTFLKKYSYLKIGGTVEANKVGGKVWATNWYVDENGIEWVRIDGAEKWNDEVNKNLGGKERWMMWRNVMPGKGGSVGTSSGSSSSLVNDKRVKVTVTNTFINVREDANIFSKKVGEVYQGEVLRITKAVQNGNWLWGRYVDENYDMIGYVALMYTNYNELINGMHVDSSASSSTVEEKVVAKAVITAKAFVNVRDGAGTHNNIVSSLRNNDMVDLYQIVYINGKPWGRCKAGWFSLNYADVTRVKYENTGTDIGFVSYVFDAELKAVGGLKDKVGSPNEFDYSALKAEEQPKAGKAVKVSNITVHTDGTTWGKVKYGNITWGWAMLTRADKTAHDCVELKAAKFTTITDTNVREAPNNESNRKDVLVKGTEFDVKILVADESTVWGYADDLKPNLSTLTGGDTTYSGWVNLSQRNVSRNGVEDMLEVEKDEDDDKVYTLGTIINAPEVNVRADANIFAKKIGSLPQGTTVRVLEGPKNGTRTSGWYKLDVKNSEGKRGWVRGDYLDITTGTKDDVNYGKTPTSPDGTQAATGRGMVANTYGGVNVRTAPGTSNAKVTKLLPGTVVDILKVTMYGDTKWGQIEQGWVCMDYIAMMDYDDLPSSGSSATVTEKAIYTGRVSISSAIDVAILKAEGAVVYDGADYVKVYASADSASDVVRRMAVGEAVTVHELLTATEYEDKVTGEGDVGTTTETKTTYWARVNDGYIKLPQYTISLDALEEATFTVTGTDLLKVRKAAGTGADRHEFDLKKGEQVKVTKLAIIQANVWGRIDHNELKSGEEAWISLAYCTKGAVEIPTENPDGGESGENGGNGGNGSNVTPTTMSTGNTGKGNYAGVIIGNDEVRVRKDPTTNSDEVTKLKKGTAISITETILYDGRSWGYCGSGWINLLYVDLTPVGITAIDAKVIATDNTLVYESSETGAKVVGSYANRAVVNIYSEMNGMYETDMGWVAKGNFL